MSSNLLKLTNDRKMLRADAFALSATDAFSGASEGLGKLFVFCTLFFPTPFFDDFLVVVVKLEIFRNSNLFRTVFHTITTSCTFKCIL